MGYFNLLDNVFLVEPSIFNSSTQSLCIESKCFCSIKSLSLRSLNQYSVSLHSLYAILILERKSFSDCAPIASSIFAPIEVPDLTICFDKTVSSFSHFKYLYNLIMRRAKEYDFSFNMLLLLIIKPYQIITIMSIIIFYLLSI